jgi:hypothetical protein
LSEHSLVVLLERGGLPYANCNVSSEYHLADALSDTSPAQRFVSEDGVVNARERLERVPANAGDPAAADTERREERYRHRRPAERGGQPHELGLPPIHAPRRAADHTDPHANPAVTFNHFRDSSQGRGALRGGDRGHPSNGRRTSPSPSAELPPGYHSRLTIFIVLVAYTQTV